MSRYVHPEDMWRAEECAFQINELVRKKPRLTYAYRSGGSSSSSAVPTYDDIEAMKDRLEREGCMTLRLDEFEEKTKTFVEQLDHGMHEWYTDMTREALKVVDFTKPGAGYKMQELTEQQKTWQGMPKEQHRELLEKFAPHTKEGRQNMFDSSRRNQVTEDQKYEGQPIGHYLRHIVQRAKQGNTTMALANMKHTWTDTGFGMLAHVVPDLGLHIATHVAKVLQQPPLELIARLGHHFPHIIYKPEGGKALKPHHDQITPDNLLKTLKKHQKSSRPTTLEWVKEHGMQLLGHLEGGHTAEDGATYVIGPMTCERLLLCLEHLKLQDKPSGPYFADWIVRLQDLNEMLRKKEQPPLRQIPIAPTNGKPGAFVAMWPVGFPHGSFSNKDHRRITVTLPLEVRTTAPPQDAGDSAKWLRALSKLVEPEDSDTPEAERYVKARTIPFADGSTHKTPSVAAELHGARYKDDDRGWWGGWFHRLGPTRKGVEEFIKTLRPEKPSLHSA